MKKLFTLIGVLGITSSVALGQSAETQKLRGDSKAALSVSVSEKQAPKADKVDVYNADSFIFEDSRTPRYPVSASEQENIANYNRSKQVWIQNNKEAYDQMNKTSAPTEEQLRLRREQSGK